MDDTTLQGSPELIQIVQHAQRNKPRQSSKPKQRPKLERRTPVALPGVDYGERWVHGPIPLAYVKKAHVCGYRSTDVVLALWYAAKLQNSNPVKLYPEIYRALQLDPKTANRVLRAMQDVGLVRAEFRRGRSPLVEILSPPVAQQTAAPE